MKNEPEKNSPDLPIKTGVWGVIRMYFSALRILHRGLGAPRVILAYLFFAFAMVSILFTVRVPMGISFTPANTAAKMQSRMLTIFMMIMNLGVYGMIMSWHRSGKKLAIVRIVVIGLLLYMDVFILGRIIYTLIREGTLF